MNDDDIELYTPLTSKFLSLYGAKNDLIKYVRGNALNALFGELHNKISISLSNTKICNRSDAKYIMAEWL